MRRLFNYDGWLVQSLCKITDALFLGVLWIVFSIPLITAGASTSALYYTAYKVLRKDNGSVWSVFWSAFKTNLKQSSIIWGVMVIAGLIILAGCYYGYALLLVGVLEKLFFIVLCAFAVLVFAWMCYLLPYTARFNAPITEIMSNCAAISFINIFPSVMLVVIFAVTCLLILAFPITLFIAPVVSVWISSFIIERVFRKYMTPEALSEERTQYGEDKSGKG